MAQFLKMACLILLPLAAVGLGLLAMFWAGEHYGGNGVLLVLAVVLVAWLTAIPWFGAVHGSRATPIIFLAMFFQCGGCLATFVPLSGYFVHESAYRMQCASNLKQIGLALEAYRFQYGSLPPACVADASGKPLYSWRVLLLPFMEQHAVYDGFVRDEPWNGPHNQAASKIVIQSFRCPHVRSKAAVTSYLAVTGSDSPWAWPTENKRKPPLKEPGNTLLVVEVADSGIAWAEPRDLDLCETICMKVGPVPCSRHGHGGFNVLFADGTIGYLDWEVVREQLGPGGTGKIDRPASHAVVPRSPF